MARKISLFLVCGILLFAFVCPVWAVTEEDFWAALSQGDYTKAGNMAKDLGSAIPEYYSLAAICYQNTYQYEFSRIYKYKFQKLGNPDNLKELLAKQQSANPDDAQLLLLQGMIANTFPETRIEDPDALLTKAAIILKDNPYLINCQALNEIKKHNYTAALQKNLQKAIILKKDYPESYLNLAEVLTQNNEMDKAINVLLDCFNNCPRVPASAYQSLMNLVCTQLSITIKPYGQQLTTSAPNFKEMYKQKVKMSLSRTPVHLMAFAELFALKGNTAAARTLMTDVVPIDDSLYQYLKLQMANFDGDFEEVVQIGHALLESNTLDYQRLYEIGNILFFGKEFQSAITFYDDALKILNPDDYEYWIKVNTNLGICSYMNQEYQNALNNLGKVLASNPQDVNSLLYSGLAYRDLGDSDKAVEYLTKALEFVPDNDWRQEITDIINQLKPGNKENENGN